MTDFNYLRDPIAGWIALLLRARVPRHAWPGLLACVVAAVVFTTSAAVERSRFVRAESARAGAERELAGVKRELAAARVAAANVEGLLRLDREIRGFRASGYERARSLTVVSSRLPPRIWLTQVSPQNGRTALTGRSANLTALGEMVRRLGAARFGDVEVESVSRLERPRGGPIFEFTVNVERL